MKILGHIAAVAFAIVTMIWLATSVIDLVHKEVPRHIIHSEAAGRTVVEIKIVQMDKFIQTVLIRFDDGTHCHFFPALKRTPNGRAVIEQWESQPYIDPVKDEILDD